MRIFPYRLPGEYIKGSTFLHDMQIEILQYFIEHVFLCPHIILLITKEQQFVDTDILEYIIYFVTRSVTQRFRAIIHYLKRTSSHIISRFAYIIQYFCDDIIESTLGRLTFERIIEDPSSSYIPIVGIREGRKAVDTGQFHLVVVFIISLTKCLWLHIPYKNTFPISKNIHYGITTGTAEELRHEIPTQQAHTRLIAEKMIECIIRLRSNLHRVIGKEYTILFVTDFHSFRVVTLCTDYYLNLVSSIIIKISIKKHSL